jgi:hypothetical protein
MQEKKPVVLGSKCPHESSGKNMPFHLMLDMEVLSREEHGRSG